MFFKSQCYAGTCLFVRLQCERHNTSDLIGDPDVFKETSVPILFLWIGKNVSNKLYILNLFIYLASRVPSIALVSDELVVDVLYHQTG